MPKSRNPQINFDQLQMFFGEPYVIDLEDCEGSITVYQPTIGDVIRMGETKFYTSLNLIISNTTSYRTMLWDIGVDWNEMSDFELFTILYQGIDPDVNTLLFRDIDITKFVILKKQTGDSEKIILYDNENHIEIDENVYQHICQYLRSVFNIFPEEKITNDNTLKKWYITKDKRQQEIDKKKDKPANSILSIISGCLNHPGFKYKSKELTELNVCQFYHSVRRLQIYEQTTAIMHGIYAGLCLGGADKLKPDDYNFMRDS